MPVGNDVLLGEIKGKLDLILADQERARLDRKQQYEKLEDLERVQERLAHEQAVLVDRIGKVEPVISEINNWRQRGIGVVMFLGAISAGAGAGITILWKKIAALMGWA